MMAVTDCIGGGLSQLGLFPEDLDRCFGCGGGDTVGAELELSEDSPAAFGTACEGAEDGHLASISKTTAASSASS